MASLNILLLVGTIVVVRNRFEFSGYGIKADDLYHLTL